MAGRYLQLEQRRLPCLPCLRRVAVDRRPASVITLALRGPGEPADRHDAGRTFVSALLLLFRSEPSLRRVLSGLLRPTAGLGSRAPLIPRPRECCAHRQDFSFRHSAVQFQPNQAMKAPTYGFRPGCHWLGCGCCLLKFRRVSIVAPGSPCEARRFSSAAAALFVGPSEYLHSGMTNGRCHAACLDSRGRLPQNAALTWMPRAMSRGSSVVCGPSTTVSTSPRSPNSKTAPGLIPPRCSRSIISGEF